MPGRNPYEAVGAFVDPLQRVLSCLGAAKISISPGGTSKLDAVHSLSVNNSAGILLPGGWFFDAQMQYSIIRDERPERGPFRVTTKAYRYALARYGREILLLHWHPTGQSDVTYPYQHAQLQVRATGGGDEIDLLPNVIKEHLPTPRISFEDAVGTILTLGAPAAREDWSSILQESRDVHLRYRSWQ